MKKRNIRNYSYKIGAVIMAFLLWLYVFQTQNPLTEQIFNVPLEVRNLAENMVLVEQNTQVQIRVEGHNQVLQSIAAKDIVAYIDCKNLTRGQHKLKVYCSLPDKLQQVSVNPDTLTINLEERASKIISVRADLENLTVEKGYKLLEPVINPSQVVVYGPASSLEDIQEALVTMNMENIKESQTQVLPIQLVSKNGEELYPGLIIQPLSVEVFVPIVENLPQKLLPINVSILGEPADGYQISTIVSEPSIMKVYGNINDLQSIQALETVPIDISGLKNDISTQVEIVLPAGLTVGEKRTVNVSIQIEPLEKKKISKLMVYKYNLREDLAGEIRDATVDMTVIGPASFIKNLKEADIVPYVDCNNLKENNYYLPVQVSLPPNITLVEINPQKTLVSIKKK